MKINQELYDRMLQASEPGAPSRQSVVSPELQQRMEAASAPPPPTASEKAEELGKSALKGAVDVAATTYLPYATTKAGIAVGTAILPGFGTGIGGILGFLGGAAAGEYTRRRAARLFPDSDVEELAPYRAAGETIGMSMSAAPWAFKIPVERAKELAFFMKNVGTPAAAQAPGGLAAGKTGEFVVRTLAAAGETARKYPKTFLASEAIASLGAGAGAGAAEARYPGESLPRLSAEVLGGLFAPGRNFMILSGSTKDFLSGLPKSFSASAKQSRAADKIQTILAESGEDVSQVYRRLREMDFVDEKGRVIELTPAQKTRSPALTALQTTLARNNVEYGAQMRKQADDSYRALEVLLDRLHKQVGDPETLRFVAEQRQRNFNQMLEERILLAEGEAARRAARITKDTPQNRIEIGTIYKDQVDNALTDIRSHERVLWDRALRDAVEVTTDAAGNRIVQARTVRPASMGEEFLEIAASMTPARFDHRMPKEIRAIMRSLGIDNAAINRYRQGQLTEEYLDTGRVPAQYLSRPVKTEGSLIELPPGVSRPEGAPAMEPIFNNVDARDLIKARGDLLAFAREAASKGEMDSARFYGRLAESALDDLQQLNTPAYDAARQFSRTVNDVIKRSYAGELARGTTREGAERIPAELVVQRAFSTNADLTYLRMREMQDAVGLMDTEYRNAVTRFGADSPEAQQLLPFAEAATQRVDSILDAQQRGYRLAAAKAIDPNTGKVSPTRLQRFVNENQTMLDQLGITDDLTDAVRAENAFRAVSQENSWAFNRMKQDGAFAKVLNRENPVTAIGDVLSSNYPVRSFSRIVQLAKGGGPDAVSGLKAAVLDHAFTKAGGVGSLDVAAYKKALFDPLGPGKPSLVNILRNEGLMTREEIRNILRIIRPMENIVAVQHDQVLLGELMDNADAITEFGLRVLGSKVGRMVAPLGASSLIAAQAGSSAVRNVFDKQPNMLIRGIMEEATKDPRFMDLLMQRGQSKAQNFQMAKGLHAYLATAGLNFSEFDEPLPQEAPPHQGPLSPRASDMLFNLIGRQPPAPTTRGTPNLRLGGDQGPAGDALERMPADQEPEPVPGPTSSSREMFQRLFPNEMS